MIEIPLFPLPLVLFPGGRLPLQIFEVRYLDMVTHCMRAENGFGVVMIEEGEQVLTNQEAQLPTIAHSGTYCHIVDFDQSLNGTLGIIVEGRQKFVIRDHYETPDRLMMASVEYLNMEEQANVPEDEKHLAELLGTFVQHKAIQELNLSINYQDARDVGWRLTEMLPCPNPVKQKLFEMKNPLTRLKELDRLLVRMQTVG